MHVSLFSAVLPIPFVRYQAHSLANPSDRSPTRERPLSAGEMSTPVKATPTKGSPVTDSPGTWRHPRLDEITRRRNATTFSEKNVRQLAYSVAGIMAIWLVRSLINLKSIPNMYNPLH
jgi:nucleoporin POM34